MNRYTGKLYAANEAQPAKMNVRFPLSGFTPHPIIMIILISSSPSSSSSHPDPIGAASFVVLDTDYSSYALICTCQEIDLFITTVRC